MREVWLSLKEFKEKGIYSETGTCWKLLEILIILTVLILWDQDWFVAVELSTDSSIINNDREEFILNLEGGFYELINRED